MICLPVLILSLMTCQNADLQTAFNLNHQALQLNRQGRYAEAESLYREVLAIHEQILGPSHSEVASVLNNLGDTYRLEGRWDEAEVMLARARNLWEKTLGLSCRA